MTRVVMREVGVSKASSRQLFAVFWIRKVCYKVFYTDLPLGIFTFAKIWGERLEFLLCFFR